MRRTVLSFYLVCAVLAIALVALFPTTSAKASALEKFLAAESLPNGVAAGDVNQDSAVLWARSTATGPITFAYGVDLSASPTTIDSTVIDANLPVTITLTGLTPNTRYQYRVTTSSGESEDGLFRTAPASGTQEGLRFGVSGDNDGALNPYMSLRNVPERDLAFFHLHGDLTYADVASTALDFSATTVDEYRQKFDQVFTENLGLNTWADLRASTSMLVTIDDHDVFNNFAGGASVADFSGEVSETTGLVNDTARYDAGLQVVQEYHPVRSEYYGVVGGDGRMDNERKFYRYNRYGSDAAFFILDTRSFRDVQINDIDLTSQPTDTIRFLSESLDPSRTLMGSQQFQDLKDDLLNAQEQGITWKFVAVPQPIQNLAPIGGKDRFEGYAAERSALLQFIEDNRISNVVFIAADLHGTVVNNLMYQMSLTDPQLNSSAFEIIVGSVGRIPYGDVLISAGVGSGLVTAEQETFYNSLPIAPDGDEELDDKDDFLRSLVNQIIGLIGYDPVGLADSGIDATLVSGDYFVVHHYAWTEFEIAPQTQVLTITTYGVPAYTATELVADPDSITALTPAIVSQFTVNPTSSEPTSLAPTAEPQETNVIYLPILMQ